MSGGHKKWLKEEKRVFVDAVIKYGKDFDRLKSVCSSDTSINDVKELYDRLANSGMTWTQLAEAARGFDSEKKDIQRREVPSKGVVSTKPPPKKVKTAPPPAPPKRNLRWSKEEKEKMLAIIGSYGVDWDLIEKALPHRTPLSLRTLYHKTYTMVSAGEAAKQRIEMGEAIPLNPPVVAENGGQGGEGEEGDDDGSDDGEEANVDTDNVYIVEKIMSQRGSSAKGTRQFKVKWKGYGHDHDSWVTEGDILDESLIEAFEKSRKSPPRPPKRPPSDKKEKQAAAVAKHKEEERERKKRIAAEERKRKAAAEKKRAAELQKKKREEAKRKRVEAEEKKKQQQVSQTKKRKRAGGVRATEKRRRADEEKWLMEKRRRLESNIVAGWREEGARSEVIMMKRRAPAPQTQIPTPSGTLSDWKNSTTEQLSKSGGHKLVKLEKTHDNDGSVGIMENGVNATSNSNNANVNDIRGEYFDDRMVLHNVMVYIRQLPSGEMKRETIVHLNNLLAVIPSTLASVDQCDAARFVLEHAVRHHATLGHDLSLGFISLAWDHLSHRPLVETEGAVKAVTNSLETVSNCKVCCLRHFVGRDVRCLFRFEQYHPTWAVDITGDSLYKRVKLLLSAFNWDSDQLRKFNVGAGHLLRLAMMLKRRGAWTLQNTPTSYFSCSGWIYTRTAFEVITLLLGNANDLVVGIVNDALLYALRPAPRKYMDEIEDILLKQAQNYINVARIREGCWIYESLLSGDREWGLRLASIRYNWAVAKLKVERTRLDLVYPYLIRSLYLFCVCEEAQLASSALEGLSKAFDSFLSCGDDNSTYVPIAQLLEQYAFDLWEANKFERAQDVFEGVLKWYDTVPGCREYSLYVHMQLAAVKKSLKDASLFLHLEGVTNTMSPMAFPPETETALLNIVEERREATVATYPMINEHSLSHAVNSSKPNALYKQGIELFNEGKFSEAAKLLEAAYQNFATDEIVPFRAVFADALGVCYLRVGRVMVARQWFEMCWNLCKSTDVEMARRALCLKAEIELSLTMLADAHTTITAALEGIDKSTKPLIAVRCLLNAVRIYRALRRYDDSVRIGEIIELYFSSRVSNGGHHTLLLMAYANIAHNCWQQKQSEKCEEYLGKAAAIINLETPSPGFEVEFQLAAALSLFVQGAVSTWKNDTAHAVDSFKIAAELFRQAEGAHSVNGAHSTVLMYRSMCLQGRFQEVQDLMNDNQVSQLNDDLVFCDPARKHGLDCDLLISKARVCSFREEHERALNFLMVAACMLYHKHGSSSRDDATLNEEIRMVNFLILSELLHLRDVELCLFVWRVITKRSPELGPANFVQRLGLANVTNNGNVVGQPTPDPQHQ